MKVLLITLFSFSILLTCGTNGPEENLSVNIRNEFIDQSDFPFAKSQKACDIFTIEEISEKFGWLISEISEPEGYEVTKRSSSCSMHYGDNFFQITLYRASEKAVENGMLKRKFKNMIDNGKDGYVFNDISINKDESLLLGQMTKSMGGKEMRFYTVTKRWGTTGTLSLDMSTSELSAEIVVKSMTEMLITK